MTFKIEVRHVFTFDVETDENDLARLGGETVSEWNRIFKSRPDWQCWDEDGEVRYLADWPSIAEHLSHLIEGGDFEGTQSYQTVVSRRISTDNEHEAFMKDLEDLLDGDPWRATPER
jgi:hypothetical protein